ncbi:MAG: hypothetical protein ACYC9M_04955 [Desulfobulbaceae bacterium]
MEAVPVRKKKRYVVLAVLTTAFLLVSLAPYFLSTGPVLRFVVSAIDKKLPGSLHVDSWLVGWQQGILCQQVVYTDHQQGIRLLIPRLTSTQGLLELALAPNNLGMLVVDSPQLEIKTGEPAATGGTEKATGPQRTRLTPFWNYLIADLEIRDGQATVALAEPALANGIRNLALSATLANGVVSYTLAVHALRDQGSVRVTGSLNLPAGGQSGLDTLVAEGKLAVDGLQVRDLLTVAGKDGVFPEGDGVLNADLQLKAVGLVGLEVSGHADFEELNLHGGFLGEDTPSFARMRLDIDGGKWAANGWSVRQLALAGDTGDIAGAGRYGANGLQLAGKGRVELPVLFAQFPHLLRLRETSLVETGTLDAAVDLNITGDARRLDFKARAEAFSGLADDHEFAWPGPVSVLVNGEQTAGDLRVHALKVEAPFLQADGRGDLQAFVLDASADLTQAFADIGQLFQLNWTGAGQLDLAVKSRKESPDDQLLGVETDLQVRDFTLSRAGELIVPPDDFSLLGSISLPLTLLHSDAGSFDLQFALSSWLGETFLTMNGEKSEGKPFRGSFSTDTSLDLDSASGLLYVLKLLPVAAAVTGDMQIQAAGNVSPDELEVREFTGEIGNLSLAREDASFTDQQVRLEISQSINEEIKIATAHNLIVANSREEFFRTGAGANIVNFAGHHLFLRNLSLTSATGTLNLAELLIPDWRTPLTGLQADFSGTFDLARLSDLLASTAAARSRSDRLAGTGKLSLRAAPTVQGSQEMSGELHLADVSLVRQKKTIPVSREVRLAAKLARQAQGSDIEIKELRLHSDPLQVEGTGVISRDEERQVIDLQGKMTPVLERMSTVLQDGFGLDLRLAGGQGESFLAQYPLAGAENGQTASLVTSLHADRLEYQGVTVRSLHVPFSVEKGRLHFEVTGQLGKGKLVFIADTDLAASPVTLTVPTNSQVLTGVQIEKPLTDVLLIFLHPLFGVLTQPSGQLDLRLESFTWPFKEDHGKGATFATVTDLRDLSLESSDLLREILTLFGLEKEEISMRDSEVSCTGRQGRVTCTPVKVRLGGEAELAISGSVGLDGTLDYLLEVPVTRKLVSEEGYRFLQGATIGVAVRGTVESPVFDRDKTHAAVKELLQQAASKLRQEKEKKPSGGGEDKPIQGRKG